MYTKIDGYLTPNNFAKTFKTRTGKPATRQRIYQLIASERSKPDKTQLDVLEIDGICFVKEKEIKV